MGVFVLLGTAMKNEGMVSDWPLQLALVIMLCLLVGTFEELSLIHIYRGGALLESLPACS